MSGKSNSSKGTNEDLNSFDQIKKYIETRLFSFLPPWLRITIVFVALISVVLFTTLKFIDPDWRSQTKYWFKPATIQFGIYILNENHPIKAKIQLIGENEMVISEILSDEDGFGTFNIEKRQKILKIQVSDDARISASCNLNQEIKSNDIIRISIDKKTLDFDQK